MAGLGDFGADLITSLGGRPTPQSQKLFSSWQRWEGGHTANDARWNPLNLTAPGSGLPTINSVGVVAMPSRQEGLRRTADLLKTGYPAIAAALRSGRVNFQDPALQADLNRWLSGKRTPGMTPYVSKIASSFGANVPVATAAAPGRGGGTAVPPSPLAAAAPVAPQRPVFDPLAYGDTIRNAFLQGGGRMDFTQLPGMVGSSYRLPPPPPTAAPGAVPSGSHPPGAAPLGQVDQTLGPGQNVSGKAQIAAPGGGWGGSKSIAQGFRDLAKSFGLGVMSEKRDTRNTASGGVSDHWTGSKESYAFDLSNGSSPTPEMDKAARAIMRQLGASYDGRSELVHNAYVNGYRVQVIYRSNVGGNHFNHIHVGVRKQ